jgi:hypothetical protein
MQARILFALAFVCVACNASEAASVGISKIETKDLELLYFDPLQTYLTPYIARSYENSFAFQQKTFNWTPWERPTVWLTDLSDRGNASARAIPNDGIIVKISPWTTTFETFSAGERFYTAMNHELVHVATMDVANDEDRWWRNFFHGKASPIADHPESVFYNYLAAPRTVVPRWYLEGSAVYFETWMSGGLGRAQGGYDEMVFRAKVRDNARFYSPLGLESEGNQIDFQTGSNDYLYGTRFFTYLSFVYSPEKVVEWLRRDDGSEAYYSNQFEKVFGKPLDDAWDDWIEWEHGFQKENLKALAQYQPTPTVKLTNRALGSVSKSYYDPRTDSIIGAFRYPGVIAHLGVLSLKDGTIRHLADIRGPTYYRVSYVAYDPSTNTAWYTTNNEAFRSLIQIDVTTGEQKMLLDGARIGDIIFNKADRSIWGVRHLNGLVTLVRIPAPYSGWNQIHTFEYGETIADLDVSPDGNLLCATIAEINGDQRIAVYRIADLMNGKVQEIASLKLPPSFPEGGTFSKDGRYVYATAYYTGVSNVFRLDLATGKSDAVSNAVTGFFRPIARDDGSLIVFEYTGEGFRPEVIDPKPLSDLGTIKFLGTAAVEKHPEIKSYAVGSPANVPLDSMITGKGDYDPQKELHLDATYPVIQGYKGHVGLGWYVNFEDPLLFDQLQALVSYSPAGDLKRWEKFHASASYHTLYWNLRYWHNDANFYDLFGPTDRSRKGDAILATYKEVLIFDSPRQLDFVVDAGVFTGLDTLPGAQNVHGLDKQIASLKFGLNYTNTDRSLGALDYESGYEWNITASDDFARYRNFPKLRAGFNFGFTLPWQHSSLWFYSSAGWSGGASNNPLDHFYLGAFGNNYVDNGDVKRYRQFDSFPGYKIDEIAPRNFAKGVAEWNLPPIRFAEIGVPAFYLGSLRSAIFGGTVFTDPGTKTGTYTLENVGLQLDLNFTVALRLPMTLSVGYAHGFGNASVPGREEILASLKIL